MYLLDTNVFIDAARRFYPFETFPGFWEFLEHSNREGWILSIAKVRDELLRQDDELAEWARAQPETFFMRPTEALPASMTVAARWAREQDRLREAAVSSFFSSPDLYVVAQAHAIGATVVTLERSAPLSEKDLKIPDVCDGIGVPCIDPFELLRTESVVFRWP